MKNYNGLSSEEIKKAKENGFILTGITGAGKTTLLNVIFGKNMSVVKKSATSVTKVSDCYYYKNKDGNCFCLIDTPGLSDTANDPIVEKNHLEGIRKVVREERIHIKGILFLINFQKERLDSGEQSALINYNNLFPLQRFWQNIIIIYTHYYACPDGDDLDDMKKDRTESNKSLFKNIMNSIKKVSDPVEYENLNIQYFNSFWPINEKKRDTQEKINNKVKNKLDGEMYKLSKTDPLFTKIEFAHIYNFQLNENGKDYLAEVEYIEFYDLNDKPLRRINLEIKNKREIKKENKKNCPNLRIEVEVASSEKNEDGTLNHVVQKGTEENSNIMKQYKEEGIGGLLLGAAGLIGGCLLCTTAAPIVATTVIAGGVGSLLGKLFK